MKSIAICLLFSVGICLSTNSVHADPSASKSFSTRKDFDPNQIHKVQIEISATEFAAIQPQSSRRGFFGFGTPPKTPPTETGDSAREVHTNMFGMNLPWGTGSVTLDGVKFSQIGLRYKGNGTIGDASRTIKKSFKIDLDRYGGTERWNGKKTINLHCGVADPTKIRETLGYQLYREASVPAPRTSFAEVWLTVPGQFENQFLGLYTLVEQPDRQFQKDFFGHDDGLLLKPEGVREFSDLGDEWAPYNKQYSPKREPTVAEVARLVAFVRLVTKASDEDFRRDIAAFLDIDGYLRYLAMTSFIANCDCFFGLGHNYYIHLESPTGRLQFFPWDVDRAFANLPIFGSNNQQMNYSLSHPYPGQHRLTDRLFEMPAVVEKFQEITRELAATVWKREKLLAQVETLQRQIEGQFQRDRQAALDRKDGVGGFGPFQMMPKPPDLQTFMIKRTKSVAAQLSGASTGFIPQGGFGPDSFKFGDMLAGPLLEMVDTDKNEKLSRQEWMTVPQMVFDACRPDARDRVTQSVLTAAITQLLPKPPAAEGADAPGRGTFSPAAMISVPLFKRADLDRDGNLTLDELKKTAEQVFDEFDLNKEGEIDEDQFGKLLTALLPQQGMRGGPPRPPQNEEKNKPAE